MPAIKSKYARLARATATASLLLFLLLMSLIVLKGGRKQDPFRNHVATHQRNYIGAGKEIQRRV